MNMNITIEGDSEGFISFACPFCELEFKLNTGELQNDEATFNELFCPYCGLTNEIQSFYTDEVIDKAKEMALSYAHNEITKMFKKMDKKVSLLA